MVLALKKNVGNFILFSSMLVLGLFFLPFHLFEVSTEQSINNFHQDINDVEPNDFDSEQSQIKQMTNPETHLVGDLNPNHGFEDYNIYGEPDHWSVTAHGYSYVNYAYSPAKEGSYAAEMLAEGTNISQSTSYMSQSVDSYKYYLTELYTLSFWYNITNCPDLSDSSTRARVYISFSGPSYKRIYYELSYSDEIPPSYNSSSATYFNLNSSINVWNNLNRNVTYDFESRWGDTTGYYIAYLRIEIHSPDNPTGMFEMLTDSFYLTNSTGYHCEENGGYESNDSGWSYSRRSPAIVGPTSDCIEGNKALNISVANVNPEGSRDSRVSLSLSYNNPYYGYFPTSPGQVQIQFDWKGHDKDGGYGHKQYAEIVFYIQGPEVQQYGYHYFHYILMESYNSFSFSNTTYDTYYMASNFYNHDDWGNETIDLFTFVNDHDYENLYLRSININVYMGEEISSEIQLLIDNFRILSYPAGDPGFEQDWYESNHITSWYASVSNDNYINQTEGLFEGKYALNISSHSGGGSYYVYRSNIYFQITEDIGIDFWWRLQELSADSRSYIRIYFEGGYSLYYVMGGLTAPSSNTTSTAVYYLENSNTTNTWVNAKRNVFNDLESSSILNTDGWNISELYIVSYCSGVGSTILNIDDLNFVDTGSPSIHSVSLTNNPTYYRAAKINVESYDRGSSIHRVQIHYRNDSDSWKTLTAKCFSFRTWQATIPIYDYNTKIDFYATVEDIYGNIATDNNGGLYYTYFVSDDVDPLIQMTVPYNNSLVKDDLEINIDASDLGSDVAYVEIYAGLSLIYNDSIYPFSYIWDTRTVSNGTYELTAIAYDDAGNSKAISDPIIVYVENDFDPPRLSNVRINPAVPTSNEEVEITVGVSDDSSLENVTLFYKINEGSWEAVLMDADHTLYSANITAAPDNATILFYIEAYDAYEQKGSKGSIGSPLSYTVDIDSNPPVLSSLHLNPETPKDNEFVEVLVDVYDQSEIENVTLYYKIGEGIWNTVIMTLDQTLYTGNILPAPWNTTVFYYLIAFDINGLSSQLGSVGSPYSYTVVSDTTPPILSSVELNPTSPQYEEDVKVFVAVDEETAIDTIILYYSYNNGSWTELAMVADETLYNTTIPGTSWNTLVSYYIIATDTYGLESHLGSSDSPFTYTVSDNTLPTLLVNGPPTTYTLYGTVEFLINGSDVGSGIASAEIEVNYTVWETEDIPQSFFWNTTELPNGNYTIIFRLIDNAGNIAEEQFTYTIDNPEGIFEKVWDAVDSVFNSYWGMLVGSGGVLALGGTGFLTSWRIKAKKAKAKAKAKPKT